MPPCVCSQRIVNLIFLFDLVNNILNDKSLQDVFLRVADERDDITQSLLMFAADSFEGCVNTRARCASSSLTLRVNISKQGSGMFHIARQTLPNSVAQEEAEIFYECEILNYNLEHGARG